MDKLLKWLITLPVAQRFVRNTVATLLVQLQFSADHRVGAAHVGLSVAVGAVTALFKACRDAFPGKPWLEYLPL